MSFRHPLLFGIQNELSFRSLKITARLQFGRLFFVAVFCVRNYKCSKGSRNLKLKLIIRYLFWHGKPPKEMNYTQIIPLALRRKSELADDVRRRFLRLSPQKLSPPFAPPPPKAGAGQRAGTFSRLWRLKAAPRMYM